MPWKIPTCCPFHVDGGDPALPCAPDIPASHFTPDEHAEFARRAFARMDFATIEARVLAVQDMPDPRTTSMREEFALFYGTRTGRFSSQPTIANKPKKDPAR